MELGRLALSLSKKSLNQHETTLRFFFCNGTQSFAVSLSQMVYEIGGRYGLLQIFNLLLSMLLNFRCVTFSAVFLADLLNNVRKVELFYCKKWDILIVSFEWFIPISGLIKAEVNSKFSLYVCVAYYVKAESEIVNDCP